MKHILLITFLLGSLAGVAQERVGANTAPLATSIAALNKSILPNMKAVYFGDSHIAYGANTGNPYNNSDGLTTWFNLYTGGRLYQAPGANLGVPGNTSIQAVTRIAAGLAFNPALVVIEIGGNDVNAGTPAVTVNANISTIVEAFRGIGAKVVISTVPPRFAGAAFSGGQEAIRAAINSYILGLESPTVGTVDISGILSTSAVFQSDGIHANSTGAAAWGQAMATKAMNWIDGANVTKQVLVDNAITPNTSFTGTAGGKNTSTGNVANNWTLLGNNAGGATVVGSKTTDNGLNQQVITISGTWTGSNKYAGLLSNQASTTLATGQITESFLDFEILGTLTNIAGFSISTTYNGASGYLADSYSYFPNDALVTPLTTGRYQLRGWPFVAPAGVTNIDTNVVIFFAGTGASSPVSGSIKIHKAGSLKKT